MKQIFRQHSRVLVLVFMALLLVVFLIDRPMQELFERATSEKIKLGEVFGKKVTTVDLDAARADLQVASSFGMPVAMPNDDMTYYLLATEAQKAGVHIGQEQIAQLVERNPVAVQRLGLMRSQFNRSVPSLYDALANFLTTEEYRQLQSNALLVSTPRLRQAYRDQQQAAQVELSVIDTAGLLRHVPEPTEAELQAAFEAGKDRLTNHTAEGLSFGYREPDRVKVEYLTLDPKDLEPQLTVSLKEARRYYEQNKSRFMKDETLPGPTASGVPETRKVQQTFEEVEPQVRAAARQQKALEEAGKVVEMMYREAARPWQSMPVKEGFREAPEKQVSFEALRDKYKGQYPVKYEVVGPVAARDFSNIPQLGMSVAGDLNRGDRAAELALRVKGIYKPKEGEKLPVLSVMEPAPLLTYARPDPELRAMVPYSRLLMRVIEVQPSGPPASLDAVREKVTADVKVTKALELARQWADRIEERAREAGLAAAVSEMAELREMLAPAATTQPGETINRTYVEALGPFSPSMPFLRRPAPITHVGYFKPLHDKVFEALESRTATSPAHLIVRVPQIEHQAFDDRTNARILLAEAKALQPLYQGEFDKGRDQLLRQALGQSINMFNDLWMTPALIAERTDFKPNQ